MRGMPRAPQADVSEGAGHAFPMVGREGLLAGIADALREAAGARGGLLLLTGEAGAGKTRLAEETMRRAKGFRAIWTWCSHPEASGALSAWAYVIRELAAEDVAVARVAQRSPYLAAMLSGATADVAGTDSPDATRRQLFDELAALVRTGTVSQPLLIVLDDVHEADASTLELLLHVARTLRMVPVLIVATARDREADWHGTIGARAELVRLARCLPVGPLAGADIAELLRWAAAGPETSDDTVTAILLRTGGNALFVTELLRLLRERGVTTAASARSALPSSIQALVAERTAALTDRCRSALAAAAVLGTTFRLEVLCVVASVDFGEVRGLLDEAVSAGVVTLTGAGAGAFGHEIVRDVVYDRIPVAQRMVLHERAGEALATMADRGSDAEIAEAARHLLLAGPPAARRALEVARKAGDRAAGRLAFEEAVQWYERAHDAVGESSSADRAELLVALAEARSGAGDRTGARAEFLRAAQLSRDSGRPDLLARAALGLGSGPAGFEVNMLDREQIDLLDEARSALPPEQDALRAVTTARLSVASALLVSEGERVALAEDALRAARRAGDDAAIAYSLSALCDAQAGPEHHHTRRRLATEMLEIALRLHDRSLEMLARRLRLVAFLEAGAIADADAEALAFRVTAEVQGLPLYLWYVPLWRGMRALMDGRFGDCEAALAEVGELGNRAHSGNAAELAATLQWCLFAELNERAAVAEMSEAFRPDDYGAVWPFVSVALTLAQTGRLGESRARLDAVAPQLLVAPRDSEWLPMMAQLAEAVSAVGSHPVSAWAYDALAPFARLYTVEGIGAAVRGPVHRHLGLLAAALGDRAAAVGHFDAAVAACREGGAALLVARTQRDAGLALDDRARLVEARQLYRELNAAHRVAELDERLGAPREKSSAAVFRRDGEVWTLYYDGFEARLRDSKGLRDLGVLLGRPGRSVAALDLATAVVARPSRQQGRGLTSEGDLGEVLDATARQAYRRRIEELADELAEAEEMADGERVARSAAERDALLEQLTAAYGLGGRARRSGSAAERARSTVTARIRDAIRRVEDVHAPLGRHLRLSVRTGTFCVYEPETPLAWLE